MRRQEKQQARTSRATLRLLQKSSRLQHASVHARIYTPYDRRTDQAAHEQAAARSLVSVSSCAEFNNNKS